MLHLPYGNTLTRINDPKQLDTLRSILPDGARLHTDENDFVCVHDPNIRHNEIYIVDYLIDMSHRTAPHLDWPDFHRVIDKFHDPRVVPKAFKSILEYSDALLKPDNLSTFCSILDGSYQPPTHTLVKRDINSYQNTPKPTDTEPHEVFIMLAMSTIFLLIIGAMLFLTLDNILASGIFIAPSAAVLSLLAIEIRTIRKQNKNLPEHNVPDSLIRDLKTLYLIDGETPMFLYEMLDAGASTPDTLVFNKPFGARHADHYTKAAKEQAIANYISNRAPSDEHLIQIMETVQTISKHQFDLDVQAEEAKLYASTGSALNSPMYLSLRQKEVDLRESIDENQHKLDQLFAQNRTIIQDVKPQLIEERHKEYDIW